MSRLVGVSRTDVYRNLTRKTYSVKRDRKVVAHTDNIFMKYCDFVIQKAGQARVRRERKKYVHAFVRGEDVSYVLDPIYLEGIQRPVGNWRKVVYNPLVNDTFILADTGEPVYYADLVFLGPKGCFANGIKCCPQAPV